MGSRERIETQSTMNTNILIRLTFPSPPLPELYPERPVGGRVKAIDGISLSVLPAQKCPEGYLKEM